MSATMRRNPEAWYLRDALRDALWTRTPQTAVQLFARVTDEYGHVDQRRLWRYLAWLVARGIAKQTRRPRDRVSEDRGYVRGTGVETAEDTAIRTACALASDGKCIICRRRAEPERPVRMAARCMRCHWDWNAEMMKALRIAREALGDCVRCGGPGRKGRKECAGCAQQQAERRQAARGAA